VKITTEENKDLDQMIEKMYDDNIWQRPDRTKNSNHRRSAKAKHIEQERSKAVSKGQGKRNKGSYQNNNKNTGNNKNFRNNTNTQGDTNSRNNNSKMTDNRDLKSQSNDSSNNKRTGADLKRRPDKNSSFWKKIMANDDIKFVYRDGKNIIHDKSCVNASSIDEDHLHYAKFYPSYMKPCTMCELKSYIRNSALDFDNYEKYNALFNDLNMPMSFARYIYVERRMATRITDDGCITVKYRDDTWKIQRIPGTDKVCLYHNSYDVYNGRRVFTGGFHVQSTYTSNTDIVTALKTIDSYSWDVHKSDNVDKRKKAEREKQKRIREQEIRQDALERKEFYESVTRKSLLTRVREFFSARYTEENEEDISGSGYYIHIDNFHDPAKRDLPHNGQKCMYLWRDRDNRIKWQVGVFDKKSNSFTAVFNGATIYSSMKNVVGWKYVWEIDVIGPEEE
jgi:hypothetical protein